MIRPLVLLAVAAAIFAAEPIVLANEGIKLSVPKVGPLTMSWPTLTKQGASTAGDKATVKIVGNRVQLTYPDATVIDARLVKAGVELALNQMPKEAQNLRAEMNLPIALRGAVTWQIGSQKGDFPAEKPAKPFLFQGNATAFFLMKGDAPLLDITTPEWAYQQLQDNREWKTDAVQWWWHAPLNKDHLTHVIAIKIGK